MFGPKITWSGLLFGMVLSAAPAVSANLPDGCKKLTASAQLVIRAKTFQPRLILIENTTDNLLWLDRPVSEPSASAGWSTQLAAHKWSALAVATAQFALDCSESASGGVQRVACAKVISACEFPRARFKTEAAGSYWVGENSTLAELMTHIKARDIKLYS